jgi:hypothetical protein
MSNLLRRVRGALGIGFVWAVVWGFVGGIPRWLWGINTDAPLGLVFAVFGFLAGLTFSVVLALTEGRRRLDQMSLPRFAAWGAVGGLLISALPIRLAATGWAEVFAISTTFAVACAVSATGSLALAKRASNRELPDAERQDLLEPGD